MNRAALLLSSIPCLYGATWLNWYWLETPLDISPIASSAPAVVAMQNDASPDIAGFDFFPDVNETLARPLFHSDRRPFEPPLTEPVEPTTIEDASAAEEQSLPPPSAPEFRIAGIRLFGDKRHALLGQAGGTELHWYSQGDDIGEWTIVVITNETVTLAAGGLSFLLPLYPAASHKGVN
jgi:hypothetical protein